MKHHVTYPEPPRRDGIVPKFEVFINYTSYTWLVEYENGAEDTGSFGIMPHNSQVHINWDEIPINLDTWEEVEEELRSIIICQIR